MSNFLDTFLQIVSERKFQIPPNWQRNFAVAILACRRLEFRQSHLLLTFSANMAFPLFAA
jgi:hypothetical protein